MEALFGRKFHPIWSLVASTVLVAVGLAMMLGPERVIGAGVVLYGAGGGIRSIARGTVPLAMFGREGYAILMGWLAMPSLLAQAASPSIGIVLIERLGANLTMLTGSSGSHQRRGFLDRGGLAALCSSPRLFWGLHLQHAR